MPGHGLAIGFREIVRNFHGMDLHIYRAAVLSTPERIHIYIYICIYTYRYRYRYTHIHVYTNVDSL